MAHLERCVVISTEKKAYHNVGKNQIVFADTTESQIQYAMRNSYNGMIIIAENYKQRERIIRKTARSQRFMEKVIEDEAERLTY